MTTSTVWSISFVVAVLLAFEPVTIAESPFSYRLDPESIQPGEHTRLEIRVAAPADVDESLAPVTRDELLTNQKKIVVLDKKFERQGSDVVWTYVLTAYQTGSFSVPPIEVQVGPTSYSTEAKALTIVSTRPDGDDTIRDEFGEVPLPRYYGKWILAALATAILMVLGHYLYNRWTTRPKRVETEPTIPPLPAEDPMEWLQKELARLREMVTSGTDAFLWMDDLSLTLRTFFAKDSRNPVETWTTREMIDRLSKDERAQKMGELLRECDLFRYGRRFRETPKSFLTGCLEKAERTLLPCTP